MQPNPKMAPSKLRALSLWLTALAAAVLIGNTAYAADEKKSPAPQQETEEQPILIQADQLISNNEKNLDNLDKLCRQITNFRKSIK